MKKMILFCLSILLSSQLLAGVTPNRISSKEAKIVTATKRVHIPNYPGAFNPSIIKFNDGYLLTFRFLPNRFFQPWISLIGVIFLDESFEPISDAKILDTRYNYANTPSQSEDARIFSYNGRLYIIFNDNIDFIAPSTSERRDMFIAELIYDNNQFIVLDPVKLVHEEKYESTLWQKNWSPFEWNNNLLLSYSITPHEVIKPDFETGFCKNAYETFIPKSLYWRVGPVRSGTPAQLVDGEYLAFFHSGVLTASQSSNNVELWHYFMGAYTFQPIHLLKSPI